MKEYAKNEKTIIKQYEEKGFSHLFRFESGQLVDTQTEDHLSPEDIYIVAEHRFEGLSNPSDMSILYVIKTKNGNKGTILAGYGPSANLELADFFKNVPNDHISDRANRIKEN